MNSATAKLAAYLQTCQGNPAKVPPAQEPATSEASRQSGLVSTRPILAITAGDSFGHQKPITQRGFANISWRNQLRSETISWKGWHGLARLQRGETI